MAKFADARDLLDAMNDLTNQVARNIDLLVTNEQAQLDEIAALRAQVAGGGEPITTAQLDELVEGLQARADALMAVRDHLQTVATDPNNPTPEPPTLEAEEAEPAEAFTG